MSFYFNFLIHCPNFWILSNFIVTNQNQSCLIDLSHQEVKLVIVVALWW